MSFSQILVIVKSVIGQIGPRLTDTELRAFLDALGPAIKQRIKALLNLETSGQ